MTACRCNQGLEKAQRTGDFFTSSIFLGKKDKTSAWETRYMETLALYRFQKKSVEKDKPVNEIFSP